MTLRIHIERLTLPDYTPSQRQRFVEALEAALGGWSASQAAGRRADLGGIGNTLRPGASPEEAARQVAAEVAARLGAGAIAGKVHV